jgi:hypothetical protein
LIGLSISQVIYIIITSLIAIVVSVTSALAGIKVDQDGDSAGDQSARRRKLHVEVNPLPMMFMIIGLAVGATLGIFARTNDWLGPRVDSFVEQWKETELSKKELAGRLLDGLYPPRTGAMSSNVSAGTEKGGESPSRGTAPSEPKEAASEEAQSPSPESTGQTKPKSGGAAEGAESPKSADIYRSRQGVLFTASSEECSRFRAARDESLKDELTSSGDARLRQEAEKCQDLNCLKALVETACPKSRSR